MADLKHYLVTLSDIEKGRPEGSGELFGETYGREFGGFGQPSHGDLVIGQRVNIPIIIDHDEAIKLG
jgi:hypothetical protein